LQAAAAVQDARPKPVTGLITGITGIPTAAPVNGQARTLALGDKITMADQLRTQADDSLEVLWDRRAVILVQPQSVVSIQETKTGETHVDLTGGTVRVALAYGGLPTDLVTVRTPTSRVITRGGIVEVDVLPPTPSFFSRLGSALSRPNTANAPAMLEGVRVLEGQSSVEPLRSSRPSQLLDTGSHARIAAGTVEQLSELPAVGKGVGLAATDRRQGTPGPLTTNIVRVHVDHALEVERMMSESSASVAATATGPENDVRGTIVATSLGVPATSFGSTGVNNPLIQGSGGSQTINPTMTSPLPALTAVQTPTVATSGGINSRTIISTVLSDDKNKGKSKGH